MTQHTRNPMVRGRCLLAIVLFSCGGGLAAAQEPAAPQPPAQPPHEEAEFPRLHISGFTDFNFTAASRAEGSRGFSAGQFALHFVSELSPRVSFFGEISLTARGDAGTGSPPVTGFNAEVERSILRFDQSDQLKVSFGRYHTPINWWNTAYHHGQWLQTTIARPEMIQFGGRFLPVHFVGGLVEGAVPAGGLNLNYKGGIGNGRASVISRAGDAGDSNTSRAWLLNAYAKPDRPFGLQVGGSLYVDKVTLASGRAFDEQIAAAHFVWEKEDPEVIAEVASVRHHEAARATTTWSHALYVQLAYRLPVFDRHWKPYYRFERIDVDLADGMFNTLVSDLNASIAGIRYDVTLLAAIKAEYRSLRRAPGTDRIHAGALQLCFTF